MEGWCKERLSLEEPPTLRRWSTVLPFTPYIRSSLVWWHPQYFLVAAETHPSLVVGKSIVGLRDRLTRCLCTDSRTKARFSPIRQWFAIDRGRRKTFYWPIRGFGAFRPRQSRCLDEQTVRTLDTWLTKALRGVGRNGGVDGVFGREGLYGPSAEDNLAEPGVPSTLRVPRVNPEQLNYYVNSLSYMLACYRPDMHFYIETRCWTPVDGFFSWRNRCLFVGPFGRTIIYSVWVSLGPSIDIIVCYCRYC